MPETPLIKLKIDEQFKNLIRPLRKDEYKMLESNIVADGCREPIIVWNGTIIDGHNRYEICNRLQIPYSTREIEFSDRDEAISWICANQLGRRNITDETRKYLIGKRYEAEKAIGCKNTRGLNQYTPIDPSLPYDDYNPEDTEQGKVTASRTAQRIGDEYHISHGTVQKYAIYSKALDDISEVEPSLVPQILSGRMKISHENIVELSKQKSGDIKRLSTQMIKSPQAFVKYSHTRESIKNQTSTAGRDVQIDPIPAIKTMPEYDPDAEVSGLVLTIPSWTGSIDRTCSVADFKRISGKARNNLIKALNELQEKIDQILDSVKEE